MSLPCKQAFQTSLLSKDVGGRQAVLSLKGKLMYQIIKKMHIHLPLDSSYELIPKALGQWHGKMYVQVTHHSATERARAGNRPSVTDRELVEETVPFPPWRTMKLEKCKRNSNTAMKWPPRETVTEKCTVWASVPDILPFSKKEGVWEYTDVFTYIKLTHMHTLRSINKQGEVRTGWRGQGLKLDFSEYNLLCIFDFGTM